MAAKKNKALRKLSFKITAGFAGFAALNIIGMKIRCDRVMKRMSRHQNENNVMHSEVLGKGSMDVDEDANNVYATCLTGSLDVNLKAVPKSKDIFIDLCAVLGKITLILPPGAVIKYEGVGSFERILDQRTEEEDKEKSYMVHLSRKNVLSEIIIR